MFGLHDVLELSKVRDDLNFDHKMTRELPYLYPCVMGIGESFDYYTYRSGRGYLRRTELYQKPAVIPKYI